MADIGNCGHEICGCPVAAEEKFCSDHCREAVEQDLIEIECDCGCPGCK